MRRTGLDYSEFTDIKHHHDYYAFLEIEGLNPDNNQSPTGARVFVLTTKDKPSHSNVSYRENDYLMFEPETRGLPPYVLDNMPIKQKILIPMSAESRSINLSNSVAVVVFEIWRQLGCPGALLKY